MRLKDLNLRIFGVWLALCAIWSTTWIFIKIGLADLPPVWFAGMRFIIASGLLVLFNLWRRAAWSRRGRDWALIALTGTMIFAVNYGLLFWGEEWITPGLSAVLQAMIPAFGLVFAHWHLPGERFTLPKVVGVALGVLGVGIIFAGELHLGSRAALWGSAAVVLGAGSASYASVLVKAYGTHLDPAVLSASQMTCGWLPLVAVGAWTEGSPFHFHWTGRAVFALFYLALVGSAVAFCLMYWLARRVEITKVMLISLVTPVAAVVIDALVLEVMLPVRAMLGGACVLLGLGVVIVWGRASTAPARRGSGLPPETEALESAEG